MSYYLRNVRWSDVDSFRMFEVNMDEYLDDETEWVKTVLEGICSVWDKQVGRNHPLDI